MTQLKEDGMAKKTTNKKETKQKAESSKADKGRVTGVRAASRGSE
jgi:hypothetical protein